VTIFNDVDVAVEVAATPGALQRILMNLISNALRYTTNGEITITSAQKEVGIEVVVQDTGRGIRPERMARIFETGEKESSSPGMGFGLAIAKYFVELQGEHIRIESTIDKRHGSNIYAATGAALNSYPFVFSKLEERLPSNSDILEEKAVLMSIPRRSESTKSHQRHSASLSPKSLFRSPW
jgi:signal transduction histidine kinase